MENDDSEIGEEITTRLPTEQWLAGLADLFFSLQVFQSKEENALKTAKKEEKLCFLTSVMRYGRAIIIAAITICSGSNSNSSSWNFVWLTKNTMRFESNWLVAFISIDFINYESFSVDFVSQARQQQQQQKQNEAKPKSKQAVIIKWLLIAHTSAWVTERTQHQK